MRASTATRTRFASCSANSWPVRCAGLKRCSRSSVAAPSNCSNAAREKCSLASIVVLHRAAKSVARLWRTPNRFAPRSARPQEAVMLSNEVALISGASRGIGQAIAGALGAAGAQIIGTATSEEGAAGITTWLQQQGIRGRGILYRATEAGAAEALVARLDGQEGLPTILVNNAGVARDGLVLRMKNEDWEETLDINLSAVFRLTKVCLKRMLKERRGRIINISSVIGSIGNAGQVPYAASK